MELKSKLLAMNGKLTEADMELAKFERGNKAAGTRLRKAMQEIKTPAQKTRW